MYESNIVCKYFHLFYIKTLRDLQLQYMAEKKIIAGYVRGNLTETQEIYDDAIWYVTSTIFHISKYNYFE